MFDVLTNHNSLMAWFSNHHVTFVLWRAMVYNNLSATMRDAKYAIDGSGRRAHSPADNRAYGTSRSATARGTLFRAANCALGLGSKW